MLFRLAPVRKKELSRSVQRSDFWPESGNDIDRQVMQLFLEKYSTGIKRQFDFSLKQYLEVFY